MITFIDYNNIQKHNYSCDFSSVNWDDTHARPHFRLVNMNFKAFVHSSSELNCILKRHKISEKMF